jgi:hypothetical protein
VAERVLQLGKHESRSHATRFPVRVNPRIHVVRAQDIDWIAAAGDYVELRSKGRSHLLRETMNSMEQKLDPQQFLRIHRSRIVRLCATWLHRKFVHPECTDGDRMSGLRLSVRKETPDESRFHGKLDGYTGHAAKVRKIC